MVMIAKLVAIGTILGMLFGAGLWIDNRYAKSAETKAEIQTAKDDTKRVEKDFKIFSTGIARDTKQNRLWSLEDRYKTKDPTQVSNPSDRQEMRQLQMEVPALGNKLDALEKPQ
jgi:predicted  nucleic acid-binding Zn-ribbon protein